MKQLAKHTIYNSIEEILKAEKECPGISGTLTFYMAKNKSPASETMSKRYSLSAHLIQYGYKGFISSLTSAIDNGFHRLGISTNEKATVIYLLNPASNHIELGLRVERENGVKSSFVFGSDFKYEPDLKEAKKPASKSEKKSTQKKEQIVLGEETHTHDIEETVHIEKSKGDENEE